MQQYGLGTTNPYQWEEQDDEERARLGLSQGIGESGDMDDPLGLRGKLSVYVAEIFLYQIHKLIRDKRHRPRNMDVQERKLFVTLAEGAVCS